MMGVGEVITIVLAGVIVPLVSVAGSLVRFEEGAVVRKDAEVEWVRRWKPLLLVACLAGVAAGFIETVVFGSELVNALQWELALSALVIAAWADLKDGVIPNWVVVPLAIAGLLVRLGWVLIGGASASAVAISAASGAVLGGGLFFVSRFITRGGVGYGDVKLFAALGLLLGFQVLFNVLLYTLIAAFVYAIFLLVTRKGKVNDRLPLGPFALIGVLAAIGFGV